MKTALITGATGGIGSAVAREFAQCGWALALGYHKNESRALQLARELSAAHSVPVLPLGGNVGSSEAAQDLVRQAEAEFLHLDCLVNCAGAAQQKLLTDISDQEWHEIIATHLDGTFYLCRAVLPGMLRRHAGRIVTISSIWGQVGASMEAAYSAAKAGVIGLTKALAQEVGPSGITVNCVAPGVIDTSMNANLSRSDLEILAGSTPLCRLGTPQEVARAVVFLAGPGGDFITGQVLGVNGGFVL